MAPPKSFFFGLGIVGTIIFSLIALTFFIQNNKSPVEVRSEYPKVRLEKDKNFPLLLTLLQDRKIFTQGVFVNEQNKFVPIKTIRIILTNKEQNRLAVKTKSENSPTAPELTMTSADFSVTNDILILKIFMSNDENGLQSDEKDKLFNRELIWLIYYATAEFSKQQVEGSAVNVRVFDDKAATEAINTYFRDGLPLKIIHEK